MIYTLTLNPSLDYVIFTDNFEIGKINRAKHESVFPGGKGINVSMVLKNLGVDSTALGFPAGFSGDEIEKLLTENQIATDFIKISNGNSRINVKIKSNAETEINGNGPTISEKDLNALFEKIDSLNEEDILVLSGSIPFSVPTSIYADIMRRIATKHIRTIVDTTGKALMDSLSYHPFLIKPNHHELGDFFDTSIESFEEAVEYAKKLQQYGAQNVLVSMADKGAVFVSNKRDVYTSPAPKGNVINSVGAGDSMVAGFIAEYIRSEDYRKAFARAISAGSASAFCEGMASKDYIDEFFDDVLNSIQ